MAGWHAWVVAAALGAMAGGVRADPKPLDQGTAWTRALRGEFYAQDQGSRLMPIAWFRALRLPDGSHLMDNNLARYGYLANDVDPKGLPIGFATGAWKGTQYIGMTCSACHTRDLAIGGVTYRVDGGPALADFGAFLTDIDAAAARTIGDDATFSAFAAEVLGANPSASDAGKLRDGLRAWFVPYHALIGGALPTPGWGPGRLDAVGMIFDRVAGLDIGATPDRVIAENIRRADAPARYPFLWNAGRQDWTQWTHFAQNGSEPLALARNLGEVYGVFGVLEPKPWRFFNGIDLRSGNSADFGGLRKLEVWLGDIGAPKYPGPIDAARADRGEAVFASAGCASCHGEKRGAQRLGGGPTMATPLTPLADLKTDGRAHDVLSWTVKTGVLEGAEIPFITTRLAREDTAFNVLSLAVVGGIVEHDDWFATGRKFEGAGLEKAFNRTPQTALHAAPELPAGYEARVLHGIWAAAPYLHNGSVPTLADLLSPSSARPESFRVGAVYDADRVGLAAAQDAAIPPLVTTGCEAPASGNSRCGHEGHAYGTDLPDEDKLALLEYLKRL